MTVESLWPLAAAAAWGLAVGVLNNRLAAGALEPLRQGVDPRSPEARQLVRRAARRYLLRLPIAMGALLLVFALTRDAAPLVAAAAGLVAAHAAGTVREYRALKRTPEGGDGA